MPRPRPVAAVLAVALVLATMWLTSGWFGLVATHGASMEPTYHHGDLVVTRRSGAYDNGDVVAFRSGELGGEVLLHRIVGRDGDRFVTRGDGNDWDDADRPAASDVLGEVWFSVPGAGRVLGPIHRSRPVAVALAAASFAVALSGPGRTVGRRHRHRTRTRSRTGRTPRPANTRPRSRTMSTAPPLRTHHIARQSSGWLLVGLALAGTLAAAGHHATTAPVPARTVPVAHQGWFTYRAPTEPSILYPDGSVDTGEPVFRSATDVITVRYEHEVTPPAGAAVQGGSVGADVVVRIGGWSHRLSSAPGMALAGGRGGIEAVVDLRAVDDVVARYRELSGDRTQQAVVAVEPEVRVELAAGETVATSEVDAALRLVVGARDVPITPQGLDVDRTATVVLPVGRQPQVAVAGLPAIDAELARAFGVVAALVCGLALAAGFVVRRPEPAGSPIPALDPDRLVDVAASATGGDAVDVLDADTFARLAADADGPVLRHVDDRGRRTFVVDDGRSRYRYATEAASARASAA